MNYFEEIKASPAWDDKQITLHIQRQSGLAPHVRNRALAELLNPPKRMLHEIKTFHCPDYSVIIEDEQYRLFLNSIFSEQNFSNQISVNQTYYLYQKFEKHHSYGSFNDHNGSYRDLSLAAIRDLSGDPWIIHSMALLHERCSKDLEKQGIFKEAVEELEKSNEYWIELIKLDNFFANFYSYQYAKSEKSKKACEKSWYQVFKDIVLEQQHKFNISLAQGGFENLTLFYNIVGRLERHGHEHFNSAAVLDKMTSDLIRELDRIFRSEGSRSAMSGNYDQVFTFLDNISDICKSSRRLLIYKTVKYKDYLSELRLNKDFSLAKKRLPMLKELLKQINEYISGQGRQVTIDIELEQLGRQLHGLAVATFNQMAEMIKNKEHKFHEILPMIDEIEAFLQEAISLGINEAKDLQRQLKEFEGLRLNNEAVLILNSLTETIKNSSIPSQRVVKSDLDRAIGSLKRAVELGYEPAKKNLEEAEKILSLFSTERPLTEGQLMQQVGMLIKESKADEALVLYNQYSHLVKSKPPLSKRKTKTQLDWGLIRKLVPILGLSGLFYALFFLPFKFLSGPLLVLLFLSFLAVRFRWWVN